VRALTTNKTKLLTIILSQYRESVKPKLQATPGFISVKNSNDCKWFLTTLKDICHSFEKTEHRSFALAKAKAAIFNCKQGPHQMINEYFEIFKELLSVLESYGGQMHNTASTATPEMTAPFYQTPPHRRTDQNAHARPSRRIHFSAQRRHRSLWSTPR
jgi:hypothetical protein